MTRTRRHSHALTALGILCLGSVLWLHGDADTDSPPAPATRTPVPGPTWGVEDPLTRLLPIDAYAGPLARPLTLTGARDEVTDRQLILLAGPQPWAGITLTFSDLHGPRQAILPHALLRWRQVASVQTVTPYYQTRYVGQWPDPLLPAAPFDIAPRGRASAWIDLRIPDGARAGDYQGTITVSSRNTKPLRVPFSLHVWGFTIPRQTHLRTAFGTQGDGQRVDFSALYDDMLAHRVSPNNSVGDPKLVTPPTAGRPGVWDWTDYDRSFERRLAQGMTSVNVWLPPPQEAWAQAWQGHLKAKGWLPIAYSYLADEPTPDQLPALDDKMRAIKQAAPGLSSLMTARGFPAALSHVDIWCPDIIYFDPASAQNEQGKGHAVWWYPAYPTTHPRINVWTDYPALDCRIWPWMTWKYNLDGMLYWSVCRWNGDALRQASVFGGAQAANGDGELLYPGPDRKPIDSIRWEALRDGLQDYEVFCLLEAGVRDLRAAHKSPALAAQADSLLAINPGVLTSYTEYSPDPQALLAARERMSRTVEGIVTALGHEPQITGRPRLHPEIAVLQSRAMQAAQMQAAQAKPH